MNRIYLGSYELTDSSKLKLECDFYIPRFSHFPDLIIEFKDELIPSTKKLAKDAEVFAGISAFLKSVGYDGSKPGRLTAENNSLVAESDLAFIPFASDHGWLDLAKNSSEAKKVSLLSVLDSEQSHGSISAINEDSYEADGKEYLVLEFEKVSDLVKRGLLENLNAISADVLAGHSSRKLADSYEERKILVEAKKEELGRDEFNEWIKQYLAIDDGFFVHLIQSLSKDDVYRIALRGKLIGHTEHHIIFEIGS
jgi:hypothetical protein